MISQKTTVFLSFSCAFFLVFVRLARVLIIEYLSTFSRAYFDDYKSYKSRALN